MVAEFARIWKAAQILANSATDGKTKRMNSAGLIVCEATGRWTTAFRHLLRTQSPARQFPLYEARSLTEAARTLEDCPGSIVAIEVAPENAGGALRWIAQLDDRDRMARAFALATPALQLHAWVWREAGAAYVVPSPRQVGRTLDFLQWHLSRVPGPTVSETDRIWNALPWNSHS